MTRIKAAFLALCIAGMWGSQPAITSAQSTQTSPEHFRLTFVITYPNGGQATQSFALDVPVVPGQPGMSSMNFAAGISGGDEHTVQENIQCSDVHKSATGLAAKVAFTMHSVTPPLPNSREPLHHQLTFEKQIDLVLDKPTLITEEMHVTPLKRGDDDLPNTLPAPPQITVTAVEI